MPRKKLQDALKNNTGAVANVIPRHKEMSEEEMRLEAFRKRDNQDVSVTDKMSNQNVRNTLLSEMGFDWFDIDSLKPNPNNSYTITDEDVKNLAGLIWNSKEIEPLILRETEDGTEIIDGERRWRACKLLAEKYGEAWRMVPGRCHKLGSITDEQANFIMHSSNIGQRNIKPSERAQGFKVLADKLVEWRKDDPSLKGVNTKTYLAEHFGVSERTAQVLLNIARNLSKEGNDLLDSNVITQAQAESLSKLPSNKQSEIVANITKSDMDAAEINEAIETAKETQAADNSPITKAPTGKTGQKTTKERTGKDLNGYLKTAKNALKNAEKAEGEADFKLIGEIKAMIREIERMQD